MLYALTLSTIGYFLASDATLAAANGRAGTVQMSGVARNPNIAKLQGACAQCSSRRA